MVVFLEDIHEAPAIGVLEHGTVTSRPVVHIDSGETLKSEDRAEIIGRFSRPWNKISTAQMSKGAIATHDSRFIHGS